MIYVLGVIWPFAALVLSIRNFNYRDFCIGVLSVAVMFGLCIQVYATKTFDADITRNLAIAASYQYKSWAEIFMERDYFIGISGKLLCYINDDLRFLAVCYTLTKAILFLRCVGVVINHNSLLYKKIGLLSILALIFVFSFYDINSTRFVIAMAFFVWCSLEILVNQKKIFYVLILISPFIHYGFWIFAPIPFIYILLKNRTRLVWILFALSFVYSTAGTSVWINDIVEDNMNEEIAKSVEGYASERGLEGMAERYTESARRGNTNRAISRLMVDIRNYGVMICTALFSVYAFRRKNKNTTINGLIQKKSKNTTINQIIQKKNKNTTINQLMNYLLIVYSLANIANSNSQGIRFYLVAAVVVIFLLVYIKNNNEVFFVKFYKANKQLINIAYILVVLTGAIYLFIARDSFNLIGVMFGNYFFHP